MERTGWAWRTLHSLSPGLLRSDAHSGNLRWALFLGTCHAGNGTMIGASADVVTVGMAEETGDPVSFTEYVKAAFGPMTISAIICPFRVLVVMRQAYQGVQLFS